MCGNFKFFEGKKKLFIYKFEKKKILLFLKASVNEEIVEKSVCVIPYISHILSMSDQLYHAFAPYFVDIGTVKKSNKSILNKNFLF